MRYTQLRLRTNIDAPTEISAKALVPVPFTSPELLAGGLIERRCSGEFRDNAYYLSNVYDWVLGTDSSGQAILVPLKKEGA